MSLFTILLGLTGCSNNSSEVDNQEPVSEEEVPVPDPVPEGESYFLKINDTKLQLVFDDNNENDIFDKETDHLYLKEKSSFVDYGTDSYESLAEEYYLPDFSGLSVKSWFEERTLLMGESSTAKASRLFEEIRKYSDGKIDLKEAIEIASNIQTETEIERLQALTVVIILLELQKGRDNGFYTENPEHKSFIDQVIQIFQEGKIKLNVEQNSSSQLKFFMAGYIFNTNTISLRPGSLINIEDFSHRALVIHEMRHLYQDWQKQDTTIEESEIEAYEIEAEYIYYTGLMPRECTPENIDEILSQDLKIDPKLKTIITILSQYVVHKKNGHEELAKQSRDEMITFIHRAGFINSIAEEDKAAMSQMAASVVIGNPDRDPEDLRVVVEDQLKEVIQFHQEYTDKKVTEDEMAALRSVYGVCVASGMIYYQARDLYKQQEESPSTFGREGPIMPRPHVNQEIHDFLDTVATLRPLSIVDRPYDGID